jgi:hypothetical protein
MSKPEQNQPRPEIQLGGFVPDGYPVPFNIVDVVLDTAVRTARGVARLVVNPVLAGAVQAPNHMSDHYRRESFDQHAA